MVLFGVPRAADRLTPLVPPWAQLFVLKNLQNSVSINLVLAQVGCSREFKLCRGRLLLRAGRLELSRILNSGDLQRVACRVQLCLGERQLRPGLGQSSEVVARIDPEQQIALLDVGVVVHIQIDHITRYLGHHRDRIAVGIGIVRRHGAAAREIKEQHRRDHQNRPGEQQRHTVLPHPTGRRSSGFA